MSGNDESLDPNLAARVSRLPKSIEPPNDIWPAIAAEIADEHAELESLARRLDRDVAPEIDLWPRIEAEIAGSAKTSRTRHAWRIQPWLNVAASMATVAVIAGLVSFNFGTSEREDTYATRIAPPAGAELWWLAGTAGVALPPAGTPLGEALRAIRSDLTDVQRERIAIEESMAWDAENVALHALWQQVYRTELELAGRAERLIEEYQGV